MTISSLSELCFLMLVMGLIKLTNQHKIILWNGHINATMKIPYDEPMSVFWNTLIYSLFVLSNPTSSSSTRSRRFRMIRLLASPRLSISRSLRLVQVRIYTQLGCSLTLTLCFPQWVDNDCILVFTSLLWWCWQKVTHFYFSETEGDYEYQVDSALTSNTELLQEVFDNLRLGPSFWWRLRWIEWFLESNSASADNFRIYNGGDIPESQLTALLMASEVWGSFFNIDYLNEIPVFTSLRSRVCFSSLLPPPPLSRFRLCFYVPPYNICLLTSP